MAVTWGDTYVGSGFAYRRRWVLGWWLGWAEWRVIEGVLRGFVWTDGLENACRRALQYPVDGLRASGLQRSVRSQLYSRRL